MLNKGKALALTLILTLTFSAVAGTVFFDVGNANPVGILSGLPSITIQSDGSVVPQTEYIKQEKPSNWPMNWQMKMQEKKHRTA